MKIISWDIGIKNLAYCIIEKKEDKIEILEWDIIDISETNEIFCSKCKQKGKCKIGDKYFCNKHKNDYPKFEDEYKLMEEKGKCGSCDKKSIRGGFCAKHARDEYKKKYKKEKIISCMKQDLQKLSKSMFEKLNKQIEFPFDVVLIENQPSLTNPKMKSISILLFSYFMIKGIMENKVNEIKLMSPLDKLKLDKTMASKMLENCTTKSKKYKITKELGIIICSNLIKFDENALKLLNKRPKKDDMADSFLQGYYYLLKN